MQVTDHDEKQAASCIQCLAGVVRILRTLLSEKILISKEGILDTNFTDFELH